MSMKQFSSRLGVQAGSSQSGFTLLEVMVAVFVIAIGLLGVISLQLNSVKVNQAAYYRTQANFIVGDIADRMRANIEGVEAGLYDNIDTDGGAAAVSCQAGCTFQQMANYDIFEWGSTIDNLLPDGRGQVQAGGDGYLVTVSWADVEWDENDTSQRTAITSSVELSVRL